MYLFSCLVTVNKYDPWDGEGPFGVGMADSPLSRPTRRCPGQWPNKRGICPIDGDYDPRTWLLPVGRALPWCRATGASIVIDVSSTTKWTARLRDAGLLRAVIFSWVGYRQ